MNGWGIFKTEDRDSDNIPWQRYFAVSRETGERRRVDVTPYHPDWRLICRVVDLGCPDRIGPSPLTEEDCDVIAGLTPCLP